jgi:hypothetical protein
MRQVCQHFFVVSNEKASGCFLENKLIMQKIKEYKKINISR